VQELGAPSHIACGLIGSNIERKVIMTGIRTVKHFDALIVGGGIAGLQSALDLADQGFTVAIVRKMRPSAAK
jgi:heterodisulfide reductase subunit A-like polyferredoxin